MEDMSAFERQLAARLQHMAGPEPHVDVTASVRAATTTVAKTRLLAVFGATRFVVAGVIVALFGGFLLAGMLTQQHREDPPAVVGASASPSPRTTDESLPRMSSREVAPGIRRITGDGAGHELQNVTTIAVADDDAVWMSAPVEDEFESLIFEAGGSTERHGLDIGGVTMAFAEDGTLWVAERESSGCGPGNEGPDCGIPLLDVLSFDGQDWTRHAGDPARAKSEPDAWMGPGEIVGGFAIGPDGTAWTLARRDGAFPALEHLGPDGWTVHPIGAGHTRLDCPDDCSGDDTTLVITPDGTIWVSSFEIGLLRFDGTEWEVVRPLGGDVDYGVLSLAANREGILWAEVQTDDTVIWPQDRLGEARHLARFDGDRWEVFDTTPERDGAVVPDGSYRGPSGIQAVRPDGTVWLTDTYQDPETRGGHFPVSFDGQVWRTYPQVFEDWLSDPPHDPGMKLGEMGPWAITLGPDGAVWANVDASHGHRSRGGIYVIDPAATASSDGVQAVAATPMSEMVAGDDAKAVSSAGVMLPSRIPDDLESGQLTTPFGPARWVHLRGDDETLPATLDPVPVPTGGYITLDLEAEPPDLWRSPDLFRWTPELMTVEARDGELTLVDDTVWLTTFEPTGLWRSVDGREWSEVGLDGLASPEPDGFAWRLQLGTPLSGDGVTIVPFEHSPDYYLISRALSRPDDRDWYVSRQGPGVYALEYQGRTTEVLATVRFEDTGGGLRVVDVEDGSVLTFLDGISIEFIERLVSDEGIPAVQGLAILDEDGLVEVEIPDSMLVPPPTRFGVDEMGFAAYGLGEDGLVHVHRSEDGRDWIETDTIGDDPGEPTDIVGIYQGEPLVIESEPHITEWTSTDGVAWESIQPPDQFAGHRLADGWLWIQMVGEPLPWGAADEPETTEERMWFVPFEGDPVRIDMGGLDFSDITGPGGNSHGSRGFISANTLVNVSARDEGARRRDIWIITFDELPS